MGILVQVDIGEIRHCFNSHPAFNHCTADFESWLIHRIHIIFNIPLSLECFLSVSGQPMFREIFMFDRLIWSYMSNINRLCQEITNNQLLRFKTRENILFLEF